MAEINNLCVFCGSSSGNDPRYRKDAEELASLLKDNGTGLVYGGGNKGIMGVLASRCNELGVHVTGVLPKAMNTPSVRSRNNETKLIIAEDMHERKETMYSLSDAFLAMPGGIGTLEELAEIFTWRQLGYHRKNVAVLNSTGYYDSLITFLEKCVASGFMAKEVLDELIVITDVKDTLSMLSREPKGLPSKL